MTTLSAIGIAAGVLFISIAHAGALAIEVAAEDASSSPVVVSQAQGGADDADMAANPNPLDAWETMPSALELGAKRGAPSPRFVDFVTTYRMSPNGGALFGYAGLPGVPALGPPVSDMRRYAGLDNPDASIASHWLDSTYGISKVLTLGYMWRDLRLEGSAFAGEERSGRRLPGNDDSKLDSRSARLYFRPAPDWSIQLSRGTLSGLDQVVAGGDVRRSTISATYQHAFTDGVWQTTLAWGRNARKSRETTVGYLAESTLRFHGSHIVFGRLERAGSDDLLRENESMQREPFKMNKVTVGYFQEIHSGASLRTDVGVLLSRHLVPSHMAPSYGDDPTRLMLFVRLKLQ